LGRAAIENRRLGGWWEGKKPALVMLKQALPMSMAAQSSDANRPVKASPAVLMVGLLSGSPATYNMKMRSSNPFADDPLPEGVVRLAPAVDSLNPYAAPSCADGGPGNDPGVGLWRDGRHLVMHLDARFPPRCLTTNEPGTILRKETVNWCYPIDWGMRQLVVEYFISPTEKARIARVRGQGLMLAGVSLLLIILLMGVSLSSPRFGSIDSWLFFFFLLGGAILVGLSKAWRAGKHLEFVQARKSYLWLTGPNEAFLSSLPAWPGLN
jgi:hypothetical protein